MKWGILGALDAEIKEIRRHMHIDRETPLFGTAFYEGTVSGHDVVLVCCGVGKVNAAVCAATACDRFGADCIVNVGIAGAMAPGLHILDVVVSSEAGFHDQDMVMLDYYPKRAFFPADEPLAALCLRACDAIPALAGRVHRGRILSGDQFVGDAQTKQALNARFAPACVEMEGAAIAHAAFMFGKPYLVIRTMSDSADDAADETYDNFIDEAAHTSATIVLKMLELSGSPA
ncbi:MAG TPA: 5'-methylthioadenosine/adenosylhomocysteine nucleosidase [Candidatus Butyricicoccus stercorigallinarum]|nr:5'-methylthioadenosine/adenosylhomocysteine nucleosidase [Candidatus Butyricicoccus stercorigallinarum]